MFKAKCLLEKVILLFLTFSLTLLIGCEFAKETRTGEERERAEYKLESPKATEVIEGTGTVRYIQLEGGFWGIISEDGEKYYPLNLPEKFKQDELGIKFKIKVKEGIATTAMWGKPVEVLHMEKISE